MKEAVSVYQQGVIACIEQFTYADEALRQYVVYAYYDKDWNLLYIGRSRNYYQAHYFNSQRQEWFERVAYVGFVFCTCEEETAREKKLYKDNPDLMEEDFIVERSEMEQRWREWLE